MDTRPDITVQNRDGQPVGMIDLERGARLTSRGVGQIYRSYLNAGSLRGVRYFLVITPDRVCVWILNGKKHRDDRPNHMAINTALPRFLKDRMGKPLDRHIMLLATYEWLIHLADYDPDPADPAELALANSGFIEVLKDAHFSFEPAA